MPLADPELAEGQGLINFKHSLTRTAVNISLPASSPKTKISNSTIFSNTVQTEGEPLLVSLASLATIATVSAPWQPPI